MEFLANASGMAASRYGLGIRHALVGDWCSRGSASFAAEAMTSRTSSSHSKAPSAHHSSAPALAPDWTAESFLTACVWMTATLFVPCYIDLVFPQVAKSVVRLLEKLGHQVVFDPAVTCCGQPPFNAGFWPEAREIARPVLRRLERAEAVVVPSGSCATMLKKFYLMLFAGEPEEVLAKEVASRTFEFAQFLVDYLGVVNVGAEFPHRVTYHDGCHGLRELGIKLQPRRLLAEVRGLTLVGLRDGEICCGFGGTFATKFAPISTAMGESKCAAAIESGAEFLISGDSSCLLHLQGLLSRQHQPLKTLHLAEVLCPDP